MPTLVEAKTLIEAVEEAKNILHTDKIYYTTEEKKGGLFKGKIYQVSAISYQELLEEMKNYLKDVIVELGLEVKFETSINDEIYNITMYSNNNSILIGKNGQTLKALETLLKAKINNDWHVHPKVVLDVENYKEKRIRYLERLALKVAKEVRETKTDAILENMNSYERRIIHNKLAKFKGVSTVSEGEEPNRHIIIKAEDK